MFLFGGFDEMLSSQQPWFKHETILERKFSNFSSSIRPWKIRWEAIRFSYFSSKSVLMLVFGPLCFGFVVIFVVERGDTCCRQSCWWISTSFLGMVSSLKVSLKVQILLSAAPARNHFSSLAFTASCSLSTPV
ncbi:hypothetical protein V6N13_133319 [Hibiscus sabdariffa]